MPWAFNNLRMNNDKTKPITQQFNSTIQQSDSLFPEDDSDTMTWHGCCFQKMAQAGQGQGWLLPSTY